MKRPALPLPAFLFSAFLLSGLVLAAPAARADEGASATVERLNTALLDVMQQADALGYQGRYDKLAPVLVEVFDFPTMARVAVGGHWSGLGEDQRAAFTAAFTDYSIGVFATRFNGFDGEVFQVVGTQPARRGAVLVQNQIVKSDGEVVAVNYLTRPENGGEGWRIVDTLLGGTASELAARRSEYSGIIERQGIETLIEALKTKTSAFAAK